MNIREISLKEFEDFGENTCLGNYYQTLNYAQIKSEEGYEYNFIGYFENNNLLAASLILTKKIGQYKYGYAPRGFMINYTKKFLVKNFTTQLIKYLNQKKYAYIKINPEIAIGKYNKKTKKMEYNDNYQIINTLKECGYIKEDNKKLFDSPLPRINTIIETKNYNIKNTNKNTRNKIKNSINKGLYLEKGTIEDFDIFYKLIAKKKNKSLNYYKNLYNIYKRSDDIDLLLVKINYKNYLINAQRNYEKELNKNDIYTNAMIKNNTAKNINKKMNSDKALNSYKNDIHVATRYLNTDNNNIIAGALTIKYKNRILIYISGFDKSQKIYNQNYFLYNEIINYYKKDYDYIDLNGITEDQSKDNYYKGLNDFKLGFNPEVYEYIGDFKLIVNKQYYDKINKPQSILTSLFKK